jgi:hypothetical protein
MMGINVRCSNLTEKLENVRRWKRTDEVVQTIIF